MSDDESLDIDVEIDHPIMQDVCRRLRTRGIRPENEDDLIRIVEDASRLSDVYWATLLLRRYGTHRAIPALKKAMYYPKLDIKITSLYTILVLARETEADFYVRALLDKRYPSKWTAMVAIEECGNESAIGPVADRIKTLLIRPRKPMGGDNTEVILGAKFLAKHAGVSERARDGLALVKARWETLSPAEKTVLSVLPGNPIGR